LGLGFTIPIWYQRKIRSLLPAASSSPAGHRPCRSCPSRRPLQAASPNRHSSFYSLTRRGPAARNEPPKPQPPRVPDATRRARAPEVALSALHRRPTQAAEPTPSCRSIRAPLHSLRLRRNRPCHEAAAEPSAPARPTPPRPSQHRAPSLQRPKSRDARAQAPPPPPAAAPVDTAPSRSTRPEDPRPCYSAPNSAPAVLCRGRPSPSTEPPLLFRARLSSPRLPAPACTGRHELCLARRSRDCACPPPRRPAHPGHVRVLRSSLEPYSLGLRRGPPSCGPSRAWIACLPTCRDRLPSG
jgi:hypothetical protein